MVEASAEQAVSAGRPARQASEIAGGVEDSVRLSTLDPAGVDAEQGRLAEWIRALRILRAAERRVNEWVVVAGMLSNACRGWLDLNRDWATEIAVRFNPDPTSVSLYVVLKNKGEVSLEQREFVADLGLALGNCFEIRAEARVVSARPEKHSFIVD